MTATQIGVAVITHAAREHLGRCLPPILGSPLAPRVLVVNSSSGDGTVEEALRLGAEVLVVPRHEFNHGTTREVARKHLGTDVVVMMTPDAYPRNEGVLRRLVEPVFDGRAAVSYGRQVPRPGADLLEAFPRWFNYPEKSEIRGLDTAGQAGAHLVFCSNVFAAWKSELLDAVGGFPAILSHEDAVVAARLLRRGYRVAYVAEAAVEHSHPYSTRGELARFFDAGYARRQFSADLDFDGASPNAHGRAYAIELLREAARARPKLILPAVAQIGVRWAGYRLGQLSLRAPRVVGRTLSGQDYYWSTEQTTP